MSENSFENSTYSENNSYDDASSNAGESLGSPGSDIHHHHNNRHRPGNQQQQQHSPAAADELMSLPAVLTGTTVRLATLPLRNLDLAADSELSELLIRKQPRFMPQAPKCAKCDRNVYKAEEIRAANKTFHKLCFKCNACNKLLEPNILTEHQGDLYCRNCYAKNFGPKGYGFGGGAGILSSDAGSPSRLLQSPQTPLVISNSNSSSTPDSKGSLKWTFSSLHANNGNSNSNSNTTNSLSASPSTSMLIKSAVNHEKRLSSNITLGGADKCARCLKSVYAAEKVNAAGRCYHKLCFNCTSCKKLLSSMNCCDNSEGDIFCKACYGKQYGPKGVGFGIGAGTLSTAN